MAQDNLYRREDARRRLARRNFVDYARYMLPEDMAQAMQPFHILICEALEQVLAYIMSGGEAGFGRLMIFMPPRYWKTLLASRLFPSWALGKWPDLQVITTSYSSKMALKNSRNSRDFVMSKRFGNLFGVRASGNEPVVMSRDVQAVEEWRLAKPHRGGSWAAGVGGSLTGTGAHLFIIDDPFKDRAEAESEARRDSLWDWYNDVAVTRLEKGGAIVIPQTRWHVDGLSGKLLKEMATNPLADQWHVLSLMGLWEPPKALEETSFADYRMRKLEEGVWVDDVDPLGRAEGAALWPEKQSVEELAAIRSVNPRGFESLYQQQPYLLEGDMFKREWFEIVPAPPAPEEVLLRMRFWDKAGSRSGKGDFAAGALMSLTRGGRVYVEHMARRQGTPRMRDELMIRVSQQDRKRPGKMGAVWHQQDPGSAGLDSAQMTNRMLARLGLQGRFEPVTGSSGSKEMRAGPWSSALEGGMVFLVRGAWNRAFIDEHLAFSEGRNDDQVDVCSWGFAKLMKMNGNTKVHGSFQG